MKTHSRVSLLITVVAQTLAQTLAQTRSTLAFLAFLVLMAPVGLGAQQPIALWDFNRTNDLLRATSGTATLAVVGGLRSAPASGVGSSDPTTNADFALQLTGFPKQGTGARTAGLEIAASTVGYRAIEVRLDLRATSTASRRLQVLYASGGEAWRPGPTLTWTVASVFTNGLTVDLSGIAEAAENPDFRVRLVSDFDGDSFSGVGGTYSTVGTWRIDHLRVMGVASGGVPVDPQPQEPASDPSGSGSTSAPPAIVITGQPRSLEVPEGDYIANGQPLTGATRPELRVAQVYRDQLGIYTVRISDGQESVLSEEASLTLLTDPTVRPIRVQAEPGAGGSVRLTWPTQAGFTYTVVRSVGWNGLSTVIASGLTGGSMTETPPVGQPVFYWVEVR
ncbi:MAG: hypothetical protein EBU81_06545 [Proteobacteria bacterium]|nr:hypothetical protein [Pseudomonadota bacterium]